MGDAGPTEATGTLRLHPPGVAERRGLALRFVDIGGVPHVLAPRQPRPRWTDAVGGGAMPWSIDGVEHRGTLELVEDRATRDRVLRALEGAHGAEAVGRWFGPEPLCLRLIAGGQTPPYLERVRRLFDAVAQDYDATVLGDPMDAYLREVSLAILRRTFPPGSRVVEVGAGTGLETIPLARAGVEVLALDVSPGMLSRLRDRARAAGVEVSTRTMAASRLGDLVEELGAGGFDGAYSTFGALNCEPDLPAAMAALGELVKPGGRLVLGAWNRVCALEMLAYGLALRPRRALARLRDPVPVGLSRFGVEVRALTPTRLMGILGPGFRRQGLVGMPVLLPPYDLARRLPLRLTPHGVLGALDSRLSARWPFNALGDYFLLRVTKGGPGTQRRV